MSISLFSWQTFYPFKKCQGGLHTFHTICHTCHGRLWYLQANLGWTLALASQFMVAFINGWTFSLLFPWWTSALFGCFLCHFMAEFSLDKTFLANLEEVEFIVPWTLSSPHGGHHDWQAISWQTWHLLGHLPHAVADFGLAIFDQVPRQTSLGLRHFQLLPRRILPLSKMLILSNQMLT